MSPNLAKTRLGETDCLERLSAEHTLVLSLVFPVIFWGQKTDIRVAARRSHTKPISVVDTVSTHGR